MMTVEERLARLEAQQTGLKDDVTEIKRDLAKVVSALNFGKGAWLALVLVGGVVGWFVNLLMGRPT